MFDLESEFPNTLLVAMNVRDPKFFDVYRINLTTGAIELDTENPGDVQQWFVDHHLKVRAALAMTKGAISELRTRNSDNSAWRSILKSGPDETDVKVSGFSPDNKSLYVASSVHFNSARLLELDMVTGKIESVIATDPQFDVGGLLINKRTNEIQAVSFVRQRLEWQAIDQSVSADLVALKQVTDGDFNISSKSLDDRLWIVSEAGDVEPLSYYLYDRDSRKATFLFKARPGLTDYKLAKMKPIAFTARDGMKIYGYLTLPPGVEPKNLPLVLSVHGGPWARNSWGWHSTAQWLANRGYAVLNVNFRGSTGYGKDYLNAGDREWAGKMHLDVVDAKDWAVKQGLADPKRICISGHSYGGYETLVGAAFTPDEFSCAVASAAPTNLATLLASIPPYWEAGKAIFAKRIGDPVKDKQFLESRSPLFKAQDIKIPLLVAQGANDVRVKRAEGDQLAAAMRKNGKSIEYMVFPKEGHGFAKQEDYLEFNARMESFLAKNLGGRLEPISVSENSDDLMH